MPDETRSVPPDPELTRREFLKRSATGSVAVPFAPPAALPAPAPSEHQSELQSGWRLISAREVTASDEEVSQPSYDASHWHPIARMPVTVLQALEDADVYKNLYYGMNLTQSVPPDLWRQDWWYRTTFVAPEGEVHSLIFNGINYRADIWVNGHLVAGKRQVVGMYNSFEYIVTPYVQPGGKNVLAVRVTPPQKLPYINGVDLCDTWLDWINWKYIGYPDPKLWQERHLGLSFVADRNAGVWKKVFLSTTGKVMIRNPYVMTDLPLPATSPAALTIYCDLRNGVSSPVSGFLHGEISRPGKPAVRFQQKVSLRGDETKEVAFTPQAFSQLSLHHPDLWWPYEWGEPALYRLKLEFRIDGAVSDTSASEFGIRKVTQHRDDDHRFPQVGTGGNFYLKVNGKDFLMRGGCYAPDLLFKNDPERDRALTLYAKDLGANLLRWELKIADDTMLERADREGIGVMQGWMCCMEWEMWDQWDDEDHWVALASLRARIRNLRRHPSAFIWANGSDGRPPDAVRKEYHQILKELHWQNAVVDTCSSDKKDAEGHTLWNGIQMLGPYAWRPPYYWFDEQFPANQGSCAEQGDNESIPPFESLKKFIPPDKLWPINDTWLFHAGATRGNNQLETIRKAVEKRYGPPTGAEDFCKKAQLAHYENTRAQFENYAANSYATHKMSLYWMLDSHWPSFFGHLIDYYLKPGGAYYGAKKGLRPVSLVFDYYATGDRRAAHIYLVNQTLLPLKNLKATARVYNLDGTIKFSKEMEGLNLGPISRHRVMSIPRIAGVSPTYFVRCQLADAAGRPITDNLYWQSTIDDNMGTQDGAFSLHQISWADFTALNTMPQAEVELSGRVQRRRRESLATLQLVNRSSQIAFFLRAEISRGADGEEVLPILYEDNYVTLFPGESKTLSARFRTADLRGSQPHLRLEGYNVLHRMAALEA